MQKKLMLTANSDCLVILLPTDVLHVKLVFVSAHTYIYHAVLPFLGSQPGRAAVVQSIASWPTMCKDHIL